MCGQVPVTRKQFNVLMGLFKGLLSSKMILDFNEVIHAKGEKNLAVPLRAGRGLAP